MQRFTFFRSSATTAGGILISSTSHAATSCCPLTSSSSIAASNSNNNNNNNNDNKYLYSSATSTATTTTTMNVLYSQRRGFNSNGRMTNEYGFGTKMADIPTLSGTNKPLTRDGEWTCAFALTEHMKTVVPKILRKYGFSQLEIDREMSELFPPTISSVPGHWITVEDFQKTPWYRRFRPPTSSTTFVSYECMKLLEAELVPPSLRNDPYSALRKRHFEDQFMNQKTSEVHARSIRRGDLANLTKGTPNYGQAMSREKYLKFCKEFKDAKGSEFGEVHDEYHAWITTVSKDANFKGRN